MNSIDKIGPRIGTAPWQLYGAEHLRSKSRSGGGGFYSGMLKDDLRKWRFGYDLSIAYDGIESQRGGEILLDLLSDFDHSGYGGDAVGAVGAFADAVLDESVFGQGLRVELHVLDESNSRQSRRRPRGSKPSGADEQASTRFSLGHIPGWSTLGARRDVAQVSAVEGGRRVVIPRERVYRFAMRAENRTKWRKTARGVRSVGRAKIFDSGIDNLSWPAYDFSQHVGTQNLALLFSSTGVGWDARGAFSELLTSPYSTYRRLRFAKFWVETMEDACGFLNGFTSNGEMYGDEAFTFRIRGYPSAGEIAAAMRRMREGSLTVQAAHRTYFFPKHSSSGSSGEN